MAEYLPSHGDLYLENTRLRADVTELGKASEFADIRREKAEATIARLRAELTRSQADEVEHRIEAGKLRAELAYEELGRQNDRETAQIVIDSLNATIARVRSVLRLLDREQRRVVRAALGERGEQ